MDLRSVSYFRECDQGLDHVHHGARDRGRGEVGQGHVGVNGLVEDEGRGQIIRCFSSKDKNMDGEEENYQSEGGRTEERNIWNLGRCCIQCHIITRIW